ncbi:hypothetical protein ACFQ2B_05440 [Streptomyces stramineus]
MTRFARIAYTETVRRLQEENGSALAGQRQLRDGDAPDPLGPDERSSSPGVTASTWPA